MVRYGYLNDRVLDVRGVKTWFEKIDFIAFSF